MSKFKDYGISPDKGETSNTLNPDALDMGDQEAYRFRQDTEHRRWLVVWMMWVVGIWLGAVLIITTFANVDIKVLCTLLATTTINVLGLSKIILNGLFSKK